MPAIGDFINIISIIKKIITHFQTSGELNPLIRLLNYNFITEKVRQLS